MSEFARWFDDTVRDYVQPPARPEITAKRHTAYAQAGLQECDACGKPDWSIDGTVVIRHEVDADEDACPGVVARKAAIERAVGQLIGIEAAQPPAPPALTMREIVEQAEGFLRTRPPEPEVSLYDAVRAAYRAVSEAPYRASYPPPAWHRILVQDRLDVDEAAASTTSQIQEHVLELFNRQTKHLAQLAAEAQRAGVILCMHEGPASMVVDPPRFGDDGYVMRIQQRYHVIWPGQVCMVVPRTQYGGSQA